MEYHIILLSVSAHAVYQSTGWSPDLAAKLPHTSPANFFVVLERQELLDEHSLNSEPKPTKPLSFPWVCALEGELQKYGFNTHRLVLKSISEWSELGTMVSYRDR